jgi:hypothetical protein
MAIRLFSIIEDMAIRVKRSELRQRLRWNKERLRTPHIGKKQRKPGKGQFPEFTKLEERNIASGKW